MINTPSNNKIDTVDIFDQFEKGGLDRRGTVTSRRSNTADDTNRRK